MILWSFFGNGVYLQSKTYFNTMLRKLRISLAVIFFACITLLFLDFTGTVHAWLGWMAKIQFLPALLAMNVGIVVFLVLLTLIFGRIYCSVICPLGVMQDVVSWICGKRKNKKFRFSYSREIKWLRYGVLVLFVAAFIAGINSFVALLAPYSSYGLIVNNLFAPIYQWGNNLLAYFAERLDSYAFYEVEVWLKSLTALIVSAVIFLIIAVLAWRGGRTYCNTVCPLGTLLGLLSRISLLRPVIDTAKCNGCTLCERKCKASCINAKEHKIDYSRCVACLDCVETCKQGAISYAPRRKENKTAETTDASRRSFLAVTALFAGTAAVKAQGKKVDGGLAVIEDKIAPERKTPIVPPGAVSVKHFYQHCTACQLCVSVCPNQVLRPSSDMKVFMQPEMSYERGYCRPECTKCSEVCPSGAILPITREEKSSIQIGHAVLIKKNCISTKKHPCGNCVRHCPTGALQLVECHCGKPDSCYVPAINEALCIGCGACENVCPVRPFSAIYVEGHEVHSTI